MEFISARIPLLAANIMEHIEGRGGELKFTQDDIITWMHDYWQEIKARPVELAFVRPDYESIRQQLQSQLLQSDAWREVITAGVGETLLEFIATTAAYSQLSIQRGVQETMLPTARMQSSVYNIVRMLGVHIQRKIPAQVQVALENKTSGAVLIPPYSQFNIDGIPFFNRNVLTFSNQGDFITTTLIQGQVNIETFTSTGRSFQRIEVGTADFTIADKDIFVVNNDYNKYERIEDGLWHHSGSHFIFYENSTPNGNVELLFGNGLYGRMPPLGETLNIIYATTLGDESHTTRTELSVKLSSLNDHVSERIRDADPRQLTRRKNAIINGITGYTLSPIDGGDKERDREFYRALAPHMFASKQRAVTRNDYKVIALQYPGIADVLFQGQRELNAKNRNYINVVGITPLMKTGKPMTDEDWAKFISYLQEYGIWRCEYIHIPPKPVDITIKGKVFCKPGTDLPKVRTYIEYRMNEQFGIQRGSLGYSIYLNDIHDLLKARHHALQVDYAELDTPETDYVIDPTSFIRVQDIQVDVAYSNRSYVTYAPIKGDSL